jgi:hypothetical protein
VIHHIVCDGWSIDVLWKELSILYTAEVRGRTATRGATEELPPPVQFTQYARWRRSQATGPRRDALERYWLAELADAPLRCTLPYDRPRAERLSGRGALQRFEIGATLTRRVRQTAEELGSTPAHVLAGAFGVWLARLCHQRDIVLAASHASRLRPEHAGVVGCVGEAMPLRLSLGDRIGFHELVAQAGRKLFGALDHHELGLGQIVESVWPGGRTQWSSGSCDAPVSPQVLLTVITKPPPRLDLPGISTAIHGLPVGGVARTELYVVFVVSDDVIEVFVEYSTDLFQEQTVGRWQTDLLATLESVTLDPRQRL